MNIIKSDLESLNKDNETTVYERWTEKKCYNCDYKETLKIDRSNYRTGKMLTTCPKCHSDIECFLVGVEIKNSE